MPKLVLTNPRVTLDGFDISDHCASISFGTVYDLVETTQMGDIAKKFVAGLEENTLSLEIQQDFGVSQVESVIYPNRGLRVPCTVRPVNGTVTATNPQYSFQVLISEWTPLSGSVGDLATTTVNWPIYGEITKTII
jgi:hypothetical protein